MTPENLRKQNVYIFNAICDEFDYNFTGLMDKIDVIELLEETTSGYGCELWKIIFIEATEKRLTWLDEYLVTEWWSIVDLEDGAASLYKNEEVAMSKWKNMKELTNV